MLTHVHSHRNWVAVVCSRRAVYTVIRSLSVCLLYNRSGVRLSNFIGIESTMVSALLWQSLDMILLLVKREDEMCPWGGPNFALLCYKVHFQPCMINSSLMTKSPALAPILAPTYSGVQASL